jgi:alpha-1,2-mannosyltransferase
MIRTRSLACITGALGAAFVAIVVAVVTKGRGSFYLFDLEAYRAAAAALIEGRSPYRPDLLDGPIPAAQTGALNFLYPPMAALPFVPLVPLPAAVAGGVYLLYSLVLLVASGVLAATIDGRRPDWRLVCVITLGVVAFGPTFHLAIDGNVGAVLAVLVALMLIDRWPITSIVAATIMKVAPIVLLPSLLLRRPRWSDLALAAGLVVVSVAVIAWLAPASLFEYPVILRNLALGDPTHSFNVHPAQLVHDPVVAPILRLATILFGGILVLESVRARSDRLYSLTVGLWGMLLLPSALWPHYYVVFVPILVAAAVRATPRSRRWLGAATLVFSISSINDVAMTITGPIWLAIVTIVVASTRRGRAFASVTQKHAAPRDAGRIETRREAV